ncbi:uncharacterized protein BDR25DRAFT_321719 [Lindgomyces ingoldianus]|uniref:Uncharacterized protein n=1 Tax=Lindgomyces ingoldianus TaxID=673940 RepID=A0ACB6RDG3_9PLEO|nr:uncharacterized protein BDR25DRAFT_321719 [Lindgomyces ingoldianus]KAF2477328.1 hypothetical protein BDR25DRAFT_321719 [Lindgomyces ingoldianus]
MPSLSGAGVPVVGLAPGPGAGVTLTSSGPPELSNLLPSPAPIDPDETHGRHVNEPYTTSLQQRQQQAADYYRAQHNYSRVSSSSGSVAYSLRRTPNFEDPRARPRASSIDSAQPQPPQPTRAVRFADTAPSAEQSSRRPRAASQSRGSDLFAPHPALRISRGTASAIHFVLEEAIRTPFPFTPDLAEENASMADLTAGGGGGGNGRAANGGARAAVGPVPVPQSDRSNIQTPRMIMNQRREREARRQQTEADAARAAEEQRKAEEDQRRRSAARRADAAGVAGAPTTSAIDPGAQRQPQPAPSRPSEAPYATYPPAGSGVPRQPERVVPTSTAPINPPVPPQAQDTSSGAHHGRPRASSQAQQQPRPAPPYQAGPSDSRRPSTSQHLRHPSAPAGPSQARPGPSAAPPPPPPPQSSAAGPSGSQPRQSTTSTFPHAFERWETLSSHWEGLTSYWIRRLEQNTDEVRREPLAQQMSRQITDLSAAGANLFHAVVELQRLRASSERKFQRWFYEHRQEQERAQEREAQLEHTLRVEREARADAAANMDRLAQEKKNAERMVGEMKRELQISKEEARRAWEELGRREQEERDRTFSLREGQPTLVGGVQVVPMAQGVGRHGSVSHQPQGGGEAFGAGAGPSGGPRIEQHYSYEEGQSPTDTDPFTEAARHGATLRHEPDVPTLSQGTYVPTGASTARPPSSTHSQASEPPQVPAPLHPRHHTTNAQHPTVQPTTSRPEAFYQQPETYLHGETPVSIPEDERSYVTSHGGETSEADEEYAIDDYGNFILDDAGHRVPYRALRERDSDEYDVQEDRRRELEHLQRYGTAAVGPSGYATASGAEQPYTQTSTLNPPDYSGAGYGNEWPGMRHHHPTRLSDVPEEDERSRTSPSRASQASRGMY